MGFYSFFVWDVSDEVAEMNLYSDPETTIT